MRVQIHSPPPQFSPPYTPAVEKTKPPLQTYQATNEVVAVKTFIPLYYLVPFCSIYTGIFIIYMQVASLKNEGVFGSFFFLGMKSACVEKQPLLSHPYMWAYAVHGSVCTPAKLHLAVK